MAEQTEPSDAVRALQADAAADYAKHHEPATAAASGVQHNDLREHASSNAGFFGRRK